jgi:hypothetical protein
MSHDHDTHSHGKLGATKIPVVLDGDLAQTLLNVLTFCDEHHFIDELIYCDSTESKLDALVEKLHDRLGIEDTEEL